MCRWGDGHGIDHADTKSSIDTNGPSLRGGYETVRATCSTTDIDNRIPEPFPNYWGAHMRRTLVDQIRKNDELGSYHNTLTMV